MAQGKRVLLTMLTSALLANVSLVAEETAPNAALKYWQAFSTAPPISEKLNDKIGVACSKDGFARKVDSQLAELTETGEYSLRMLHRGASIEACDWGTDMRADGAETLLPHLAKARQLARLALVRARVSFERRHDEQALDDIIAAMTIARHVSHDGTIIGVMLAYSIDMSATQVLAAYLTQIDTELVERTMTRRRAAPDMMSMQDAVRSEVKFIDWAVDKLSVEGEGQLLDLCSTLTTSKSQTEELLVAGGNREQFLQQLESLRPLYGEMQMLLALPHEQFEARYAEFFTRQIEANPIAKFITPNVGAMHKASIVHSCRVALFEAAVAIRTQGASSLASHDDLFGDGPFERVNLPLPGQNKGAYRLNSKLEREVGKPVSLAVGIAVR